MQCSEACVLVLLTMWVAAGPYTTSRQKATAQQQLQLLGHVRVLQLGPAFATHIMPVLSGWDIWAEQQASIASMRTLLMHRSLSSSSSGDSSGSSTTPSAAIRPPAYTLPFASGVWDGPQGWLAPPRSAQILDNNGHPDFTLTLKLDASQLQDLEQQRTACIDSPPHYVNGHMLVLRAQLSPEQVGTSRAVKQPLGLFIATHSLATPFPYLAYFMNNPSATDILPCLSGSQAVLLGPVTFELTNPALTPQQMMVSCPGGLLSPSKPLGCANVLGRSSERQLLPCLARAELHITAKLSSVDQPWLMTA